MRRTDKKAEARYHDIEEYMVHVSPDFNHISPVLTCQKVHDLFAMLLHYLCFFPIKVEEWYDRYQLTHNLPGSSHRRIYIATDEPKVIADAKSR